MSSISQWEVDTFCQSRSRRSSINHSVCDGKCVFLPNEDPLLKSYQTMVKKIWSNMRGFKGKYLSYQMQKCKLYIALHGSISPKMQTKGNVQKIWKPEYHYCIAIKSRNSRNISWLIYQFVVRTAKWQLSFTGKSHLNHVEAPDSIQLSIDIFQNFIQKKDYCFGIYFFLV